jgi:sterol 3beta-glucosyltransferase
VKLLLITAGSRGDVEPFVALARHAAAAGHEVRVAAPDNSGVSASDVDVVSLDVDYSRLIEDQGVSVVNAMRNYRSVVKPIMRQVIVGAARIALAFRPDVIVYHPKILSAPLIADALGIPHVLVEIVPSVTPTREFPAAGTLPVSLGPLNRLTYLAAGSAAAMFRAELDEAAAVLGRARANRPSSPAARLLPISPAILDRPDDWPADVHLTGPWRTGQTLGGLEPAVAEFIGSGPFVYAGFGSMAAGDPVARGRTLVAATRDRGKRLLVATGLGGVQIPVELRAADLLVTRSVPHELVLPHATLAVHHGGIGTIQAATIAGTVSVVIPFIADQPFWGAMLHRRGLSPAAIPQRRLTPSRLGTALDAVPAYRDAVTAAAGRMAADTGIPTALRIITGLD